jgi:hypothetical protein
MEPTGYELLKIETEIDGLKKELLSSLIILDYNK